MNGASTGGGNEKAVAADEASEPQGKASLNDTSSIPDGGIQAWMQVGGTFFVFFNTWQVREIKTFECGLTSIGVY